MKILPLLLREMELEGTTTRKMLQRVPAEKFDFKPHPRSMTLQQLTVHIAELPGWVHMALHTDGIDFENFVYEPTPCRSTAELLSLFESSNETGKAALHKAKEVDLHSVWTMRKGSHVISEMTRYETIRHALAQTIHHRAQLGVYLRLLDVPIPGSYGPSADEPEM